MSGKEGQQRAAEREREDWAPGKRRVVEPSRGGGRWNATQTGLLAHSITRERGRAGQGRGAQEEEDEGGQRARTIGAGKHTFP